jgi:hypothetical protein
MRNPLLCGSAVPEAEPGILPETITAFWIIKETLGLSREKYTALQQMLR